ncbi:hypothetical protein [Streptomyces sp. NPDC059787]|uniref:hypothetical protein n=1 Tax=Streptomyces sp. NPDC059787 TaxID=3346947 RepID=UPI003661FB42
MIRNGDGGTRALLASLRAAPAATTAVTVPGRTSPADPAWCTGKPRDPTCAEQVTAERGEEALVEEDGPEPHRSPHAEDRRRTRPNRTMPGPGLDSRARAVVVVYGTGPVVPGCSTG